MSEPDAGSLPSSVEAPGGPSIGKDGAAEASSPAAEPAVPGYAISITSLCGLDKNGNRRGRRKWTRHWE